MTTPIPTSIKIRLRPRALIKSAASPPTAAPTPPPVKPKLRTEDTGKKFEMAICLAYIIPYNGKYTYEMAAPQTLSARLTPLTALFPPCEHTASKGSRYDYTALADSTKHLSAKTTKKGCGKVAPQVIGQAQPEKFCEVLGLTWESVPKLKETIQTMSTATLLSGLAAYTFDCPTVYYNEDTSRIRFITPKSDIDWSAYTYSWTQHWSSWNNSSTLKLKDAAGKEHGLVEFQFHTKSRTNMAVRWCYDTVLDLFADNFTIVSL